MIFWTIFLTIAALALLLSLKGWASARTRAAKAAAKAERFTGAAWTTVESEIDDYVNDARRLWPVLRPMSLFWIAMVTLTGMVALNVYFGWITGGRQLGLVTIILILFFTAADVVLAVRAVVGDRGNGEWYAFTQGDRSTTDWVLISICTALSMLVVILSTADVHRGTAARQDVTQNKWSEMQLQVDQMTLQRKILVERRTANGGLSRQALEARAKEASEAADREAKRVRCGIECEKKKAEALKWEAQAADARTEDELTEKIASLQAQLANADDIKEGTDPVEDFAASVGTDYKTFKKWLFIVIGLTFAVVNTLLWLMVGDEAGRARAAEYARRASIGDVKRQTAGYPPKYTVLAEPQVLLPAPASAGKGDTIVVNLSPADQIKNRFANDDDLLEVNSLFGLLIVPNADGVVTIAELYRLYQVDKLRGGAERYMTQPTMVQKINTISQHRDDVKFTADGRLPGWTAKQSTSVAAE